MSEIYKRSMGFTYDERALAIELGSGTAGYDTTDATEIVSDELSLWGGSSDNECAFVLAAVEADVDQAEQEYEHAKAQFESALADESIADGVAIIAGTLTQDLYRRLSAGQPIDEVFFEEAHDMAQAIVVANPEFDATRLTQAAHALVRLQYAERALIHAEQDLQQALAA